MLELIPCILAALPAAFIVPLMLAGTGIAAYGAYQQGQAQKAQSKNQAALAAYNAQVAQREGEAKRRAAEAEAARHQRRGAEIQAAQKAAYGKSGVSFSGSPLTVIADTAAQLELDRLTILREGMEAQRQAYSRAGGLMMESQAYKTQASYAGIGGILSGTGTALTGLGTAGYTRWQMKQAGSFGNA